MMRAFPITSGPRYEALNLRQQDTYRRVLDMLDLMDEHPDWPASHAAEEAGTTLSTARKYAGSAFAHKGHRWRLRANDRLYRGEVMPMLVPPGDPALRPGGVIDVHPTTRRQRSAIGSYWNRVELSMVDPTVGFAQFRRERIAGHRFETDPDAIRDRYLRGELDIVVEVSPRV